jgi:hypothetical protein
MQSNSRTIGVGIVVVAVAVALFFVFKGGGDDNSDTTATATTGQGGTTQIPTIVVKNGQPVGGIRELDYTKGDQIRFKVDSDVSDEVHVHGYDIAKDVKAGGTVSFDFPADIEGVFEAELESRKEQIIELRVNP